MMQPRKNNPRAEYRLLQAERINASSSLTEKFPGLKSLTVNLEYFDSTGVTRNGVVKYKANIEKAKAVFYFNCPNAECAGGDYDLTEELSRAISRRQKVVAGEVRCNGVRHNKMRKERVPCLNLLRYELRLGYQ
jgi:hypothetical protein